MLTADQLGSAVEAVLNDERTHGSAEPLKRYGWLTEVDLAARVADYLARFLGKPRTTVRVVGQDKSGTKHDVEVGDADPCDAIEFVLAGVNKADGTTQPAGTDKAIEGDLTWLLKRDPRCRSQHVVVFFPKLVPGYGVQRSGRYEKPDGTTLALPPDALVLGAVFTPKRCAQPPLSELLAGVADARPPLGSRTATKYSMASAVAPKTTLMVDGVSVDRRRVGSPSDATWALTFTRG